MTLSENEMPKVGVWRALGSFSVKELVWPEGALAAVLGLGGSIGVIAATPIADRVAFMSDMLVIAGAVLAVVFTALAIVVSLPSTWYLRLLAETPQGGMRRFLDPFLIAVGTQVVLIFSCVGYQLLAVHVPHWSEHAAFSVIGFLFAFSLFDVAALARQLVKHGIFRSYEVLETASPPQPAATVSQLQGRNN